MPCKFRKPLRVTVESNATVENNPTVGGKASERGKARIQARRSPEISPAQPSRRSGSESESNSGSGAEKDQLQAGPD